MNLNAWPWPWKTAPAADPGRWVVVDVETTGLDARTDQLLAIAAVAIQWDSGHPVLIPQDRLECLVQPMQSLSTEANVLVHHIGIGRQRSGLSPALALREWVEWLSDSPVLAFHAPFDRLVLSQALKRQRMTPPANPWADLADVCAVVDPEQAPSLDLWLHRYGIRPRQRHRALEDAWVTAELFLALWPDLKRRGIRNWGLVCEEARAQAAIRRSRT